MVTEKDLKIGVKWKYETNKFIFTSNPCNGYIEFINLSTNYRYKNYIIKNLLEGFNNKSYILCKPIEKIYETW